MQIEDGGVNSAISFMQVSWKENRNSDLGEKNPVFGICFCLTLE